MHVSVAGGWHYCGNEDDDSINGTLYALSLRIPTVWLCGWDSVAEAEYAACFNRVLAALGHQEASTHVITVGICNHTITLRDSLHTQFLFFYSICLIGGCVDLARAIRTI